MAHRTLIILLGNTNDSFGKLSVISNFRCEIAFQKFKQEQDCRIIPTGGFGLEFNNTVLPHHSYLKKQLISLGVPEEKILDGTDTRGTYQDLLVVRRVLKNDFDKIFVVTLNYHRQRVEFICNKIFTNYKVITEDEFPQIKLSNETLVLIEKEEKIEVKKIEMERQGWIDIPLDETEFPVELYENAGQEHKHYDTISIALVSGILIITSAPMTVSSTQTQNFLMLLITSLINFILLLMYFRAAKSAKVARRTMIFLELAYGKPGFSANHDKKIIFKLYKIRTWGFREFAYLIFFISLLPLAKRILSYVLQIWQNNY